MAKITKQVQKYLLAIAVLLVVGVAGVVAFPPAPAVAQSGCGSACCGDKSTQPGSPCLEPSQLQDFQNQANKQNTATKGVTCPNGKDCGSIISKVINPLINLMTALVGVVVAISIVVAGITYSAAGGDPGKVAAAKKRMTNSIIALIAYIFTFGLLQWLVPGGLL